MTVILVLVTFSIFIALDWVINRRKAPQVAVAPAHTAPQYLDQSYVEGFLTPEQLSYHPGHSWAMQERRNLVRIGLDDFAAALAGRVERIERSGAGWAVVTDQGVINSSYGASPYRGGAYGASNGGYGPPEGEF